MPDVSPLLEKLPFENYTSQQIWDYFYANTKKRITDFSDIQGNRKINHEHTFFYTDSDNDGKYDKNESFSFFLTLFSSEDDSLLEALYQKLTPLKHEIIILVENNSTDVFSGASYYIKLGDNLHERLLENDNFFTEARGEMITDLPPEFGVPSSQFNTEAFNRAIKTIKEKGAGKHTDVSTYQLLQAAMFGFSIMNPNVTTGLRGLNKIVLGLLDDGIEGLNNSKYKSNQWNFSHTDKKINLVFFPKYSAYRNYISENEIELAMSAIGKKIKSNIKSLRHDIDGKPEGLAGFSILNLISSTSVTNLPKQVGGSILLSLTSENIFDEISNSVDDFVSEATKFILEMIDNGFIFMNALICGFVNSLISTIEGLLFIIKLPFWLMEKTLSMFLSDPEKMDETVQAIVRFDFSEAKKQFWSFLGKLAEKISKFDFSKFLDSIGVAQVGYFIGCIVEFIVEIIIGALTFGTYTVTSIATKVGNVFKSIIETIFKIVRKFFNVVKGVTVDSAKLILKIFAKGTDEFGKLLDEIWLALKKWIDEIANKAYFEALQYLSKIFKRKKVVISTFGTPVDCFVFKKGIVPVDKILKYATGRVNGVDKLPSLEKEFAELKSFRQNKRKIFDQDKQNEQKLVNLKRQIKNCKNSIENKKNLGKIGLNDYEKTCEKLTKYTLSIANKNKSKIKKGKFLTTVIKGPKGRATVQTTWAQLETGEFYLTTIKIYK